jgi:nicotinate-nucleotide adenylyltransferase
MRLALFGGTFDPIHRGHLAIARAAADAFALDRVLVAPAGRQPLKPEGSTGSFEDRLAMVTLACRDSGDPRLQPSALDAPRPGRAPNYTVGTLLQLTAQHPRAQLFALAGADSFATITTWREPHRLLELAEWIVVSRPGFPLSYPAGLELTPHQRARIHLLHGVYEDVAATHLRTRLSHGDPCEDLLAPSVASFIAEHALYRTPRQ